MAKPYSIDLRERVIEAVGNKQRIVDVAKSFKVCRKVIYNWLTLQKKTGKLESKKGYQKGHSHKITDWDSFKKFAMINKHRTVKEMVVIWEKENNCTISASAIERGLKKIGYTSKKKLLTMLKRTPKSVGYI